MKLADRRYAYRSYPIGLPSSDPAEIGWAAGLYEGEGTFHPNYTKDGIYFRMAINMTNRGVLEKFQRIVGCGSITGPYTPSNPRWSQTYTWRIGAYEGVQQVVNLLWDHLSPERQEQILRVYSEVTDQGQAAMTRGEI